MTLEEAKNFYFKCMCIDYNMFNSNVEKYHELLQISTKEIRKEWEIEYIDSRINLIYTDKNDAAHHFRNASLLLARRDMKLKNLAERIVEVYETCPFEDNFSKLMVAEGLFDEPTRPWGNGMTALYYYYDCAEEIKNATDRIYSQLSFDADSMKLIYEKYPSIKGFLTYEKISARASKIAINSEIAYAYLHSDKYQEDLKKHK